MRDERGADHPAYAAVPGQLMGRLPDVVEPRAPASESEESVEAMNCIAVRIFCFQGPTRNVSMWYHLTETVDEFLTRADILHNPDVQFMRLLPVEPHPDGPFVALLFVPRWWAEAQILPALYIDGHQPDTQFLHAAHVGETLEDAMPLALLQNRSAVSLYVPPVQDDSVAPMRPDALVLEVLQAGSHVAVLGAQADPPVFRQTHQHLRSLDHDLGWVDDDVGRHAPLVTSAVLLGVRFEQFLITLGPGPVREQIALALEYPPDALYLQQQPACFDKLVVAGVPVAECWGFRDIRIFGRHLWRALLADPSAIDMCSSVAILPRT